MKDGWRITGSYPTRSLREYLAYTSAPAPDHPPSSAPARIELEVEVGDGRAEVILVDAHTDIDREAVEFCRKHELEDYVADLLAQTIRQQYQQELEEAQSQAHAREEQELMQQTQQLAAYSRTAQPRELLVPEEQTGQAGQTGQTGQAGQAGQAEGGSTDRGAGRLLRGYHSRAKKYSLGENYLLENKENRPELNKVSLQICSKLGKDNILEERGRRSREKRAAVMRELKAREEEELRECPFRPKINAISQQVDQEIAATHQQRFQRLYDHHRQQEERRSQQRAALLQELPFRPALNYISRKIVESKRTNHDHHDHQEHRTSNHDHQDHEGSHAEKRAHMGCSTATNNSLPHTGRGPRNRNTDNLPIGEYLYAQAMKKPKPRPPEQRNEVKALDHSDHIVAALKERRINEVFSELTHAPHEELSCEDVELSAEAFRTGRYRLFMPIFQEMAEMGISLTRSEFLEASLALLRTMSPEEKHEVIFPPRDAPEPALAPARSREKLRRNESDIYNRGVEHRRTVEERNAQSREDRARDELRHCTFRPFLKP